MAGGLGRLGLQQQLLVVVMRGQHAEGVSGGFWRAKRRSAGIVQHAPQRPHAGVAHETGHHGLPGLGRDLSQLARHGRHVGQRVRRQQHQHAVHACIVQHGVEDRADALGRQRHIGDDGIGDGRVRLQHGRQRPLCRGRQLGLEHGGVGADQVQGQLRRSVAVGDQRHAPPLRPPGIAQHLDRREQLHEVAHPHRAGAPQRGVEHSIAAVGAVLAGLEHDDRLHAGGGAQHAHELARRPDVLQIEHDAVGARVAGQVVQHLGQADHGLVAQRDGDGKADVHVLGPVHDRRHDGARLGQQGHPAGRASTGCWLRFRPACGRCAPKERGPSSSQRFSSAQARHSASVPRGYGSGSSCGSRMTERGDSAASRRSVSGSTAGDTQTRARSGRSPGARPFRLAGSSGASPTAQSTTVQRALSAGDRDPAAGRPVGHDHQRTGFEHRGQGVSQHGVAGAIRALI